MRTCDFCDKAATWDTKTVMGPWASACDAHFAEYGTAPSTNLADAERRANRSRTDRKRDASAALDAGDFDAFMDACGDGDPLDFL